MSSNCTTGIQNCLSYFNPYSSDFEAYQFSSLTCSQKLGTIIFSILGCGGCGIGSLAAYRVCLKNFLYQAQAPRAPLVRIQISILTLKQDDGLPSAAHQPAPILPHVTIAQEGQGDQAVQIVRIPGQNPVSIRISTHHVGDSQNYNSAPFSERQVLHMVPRSVLAPVAGAEQTLNGVSLPGVPEA